MTDAPPPATHWQDGWQGQALRFIIVGLGAAALDYGVLRGLMLAGLSPYLARTLSMAAALLATWQANRRMTFRTAAPPSWRVFLHYAATSLLGIGINYAVYSAGLLLGLPLWLAFCLGTGIAAVFNFLRYRVLLAPGKAN